MDAADGITAVLADECDSELTLWIPAVLTDRCVLAWSKSPTHMKITPWSFLGESLRLEWSGGCMQRTLFQSSPTAPYKCFK